MRSAVAGRRVNFLHRLIILISFFLSVNIKYATFLTEANAVVNIPAH